MKGRFDHLSQRWQDAITAYEQASPSQHIREDYRAYLGGLFAHKSPDEITPQDVQDYALGPSRRGLPVLDGTRRQRISVPSKFYEFAKQYIPPGETAPITTRNPTRELLSNGELPRLVAHVKKEPFPRLDPAWRACVRDFLEATRNISGSQQSWDNYNARLRNFFDMFPLKSPGDMTRTDALAYINRPSVSRQRHGQEVSAQTKNGRHACLSSFYEWASTYIVEGGQPIYQKASPLVGVRYLKTGMNPRALSDESIRLFFNSIDRSTVPGRRAFCVFYLYWITGRRRMELARLRFGDIQKTTFFEGGISRPGWQYSYTPKGNSRQKITRELPESAVSLIFDLLEFTNRLATIKPEDWLFVSSVPGRGRRDGERNAPLSPQYIYQEFKRIAALAGIPSATLHGLRHSAAVTRYNLTHDIYKLAAFLGHTNISTSDRYIRSIITSGDSDSKLIEAKYAYLLAQPGSEAKHV